ncbi:MAG: hypothetical protein HY236_10775 [Acidobacteria bacterium]|nr:hypothetical protein [Acidobacteriota bacterium]
MHLPLRVGLVPLYVEYYETVVPGIQATKLALIEKAKRAIGGEYDLTVFDPVRGVEAARLTRASLLDGGFDCLIVLPLVATFSQLSDELVQGWRKPLLLLSAMAGTRLPHTMTMTRAVAESQSFGSQAIANGWMRQGIRFKALHLSLNSVEVEGALQQWLRVQECLVRTRTLRIGLIGEVFGGMTDVLLPAKQFEEHAGAAVVPIPMRCVHAAMRETTSEELQNLEGELRKQFAWGRFSAQEKNFSLRAAVAIRKLVGEKKLDCAAFNSHGPEGLQSRDLGLMAALGITLATTSGCPMAEVGDLCTAFAMWLGRRLSGASYYTELDSAYMSEHEWFLLNSGEYDLSWLRPGVKARLVRNTNFAGKNGRGVSICAPLRQGSATILNFTPTPNADSPYRIQYCEGKILKKWHQEMGVGNARFEIPGSASRAYGQWLEAGPVHHSATCPGHLGPALSDFCEAMGWTTLEVRG